MTVVYNKATDIKVKNKETSCIKKIVLRIRPDYVEFFNNLLSSKIVKRNKKELDLPYWENMIEYKNNQGEQYPMVEVIFLHVDDITHFNNQVKDFDIQVKESGSTQSFYVPCKWEQFNKKEWISDKVIPTYSINILSYNRYQDDRRLTVKALEEMDISYRIFVEPCEYQEYAKVIDSSKIIQLPDDYHNYKQGGIPARNFIKWYSTNVLKEEKHWILDDNIMGFYRYHMNKKVKIRSGLIFKSVEQFCNRYENIGMAGFNYFSMIPEISDNRPPIRFNGKVFSCILITNSLLNWRGVYNEDIDMALRLLKLGYVNCEFNHILINKCVSGTVKGGNTSTIYLDETKEDKEEQKQMGYKKKVDALIEQHPDVSIKYKSLKSKEYHHNVDYSPWENNTLVKKIIQPKEDSHYDLLY